MAEFLIKAVSATHADAVKDARGSYKRGDVVVVMPDGHPWGSSERLPKCVVVKIPSLSVAQAQQFVESESVIDVFTAARVITRRRRWRVRVDDVPLAIRNALRNNGEVTVSYAEVRNFIENKTTLALASEVL